MESTSTTAVENPLTEMFLHNLWANQQLLRVCQPLTDDQLAAICEGTYGSIHETLLHIVRAEAGYLRTLGETVPECAARLEPDASIEELRECAAEIDEALVTVAGRIGPSDTFSSRYEGRIYQLPGPRCLVQVINHATEHRAQIATILTQLGIEPPELSGWTYMFAMGMESVPA